jgi:hypothetical protein
MFLTSCFNDEVFPSLPPETQEGLNTFGCLVDGVLLLPVDGEGGFGGTGGKGLIFTYRPDSMVKALRPPFVGLNAKDRSGNNGPEYIYIYIPSLKEAGIYQLCRSNGLNGVNSPPNPHIYAGIWNREKTNTTRYISFVNSGQVVVTKFDTINSIYSATFSCRLVDQETNSDTIEVTQGRFDIDWSLLD